MYFISWPGSHRALHSFPTRRSSDLVSVPADGSATVAILRAGVREMIKPGAVATVGAEGCTPPPTVTGRAVQPRRSEEHTSELQSLAYLVCRLLLEKKTV